MSMQVTGKPHPREDKVDTSRIASIRMGTTVRTRLYLTQLNVNAGRWAASYPTWEGLDGLLLPACSTAERGVLASK